MTKGYFRHVSRKFASRRFEECIKDISSKFLKSFKGVSRVFQMCFKEVSRKCSRCFREVSSCMSLIAATEQKEGLFNISVTLSTMILHLT